MNKKSINIILIISVCFIWAIVIFRIVGGSNQTEVVNSGVPEIHPVQSIDNQQKDFIPQLKYRDPFLDQMIDYETRPQKKVVIQNQNQKQAAESVQNFDPIAVELKFRGLIKNNSTSAIIALISFNGKSIRLSPGQSYDGFRLERTFRDSALLIRNKEKIIVRK